MTLLAAAFFLSGLSALVYQVSWQRILALHSGAGIYSVVVIVAAFMAGLGFGSWLGGVLSPRVAPRRALALFALLELSIGAFGALSPWLYNDLYPRSPWLLGSPWRAGALHFVALAPPTAAMGMSLPFLARGVVREAGTAALRLGALYGLNVLGAGAGALLAPWWLVRRFGIDGALAAAALANLAAASLAALAALRPHAGPGSERRAGTGVAVEEPRQGFGLWLFLYALGGFLAFGLEVLWFRVMDVAVKATPFTFGTVLCVYLVCYGGGSLAAAPLAQRSKRPLQAFLALQSALAASAALPIVALSLGAWPHRAWYSGYWRHGEFDPGRLFDWTLVGRLYVLLPLLLYGLPTFLMGLSFPVLQRAVQDEARTSGLKVGLLQASNILGCVAGTLAIGLVALDRLGTAGSLRLLVGLGSLFAACGAVMTPARARFAAALALLAALAAALPRGGAFWRLLHGVGPADAGPADAFLAEDASGVAALIPEGRRYRVYVNGRSHSWLPYGGIHTRLGALPAIVHPQPRAAAIVGLGSGDTAWGAGCRPETGSITVFEIIASQPRLLRELAAADPARFPELRAFLSDPRVSIRIADGRNALALSESRYDVIQADALRPDMAGSGNLYSHEFFALCARRLQAGGLMCTWSPTPRVLRTFRRVFPHVLSIRAGEVLVGSLQPIPHDPAAWRRRAEASEVRRHLGDGIVRLVLRDLDGAEELPAPRRPSDDLNRDLFPRDEFAVP